MPLRIVGTDILALWRAPSAAAPAGGCDPLDEVVVGLFDELRGPLLRYLSSFGLAIPDGEEIVQEVFLSLHRHLRNNRSSEHLRGWLFRAAHNQALKRRDRNRRESVARTSAIAEEFAIDPEPSPEAQAASTERQQRLLAVVRALPEQDRRCLFLRAEGLRYREIAGILDISLGSVSLSLTRSLQRIGRAAGR
jgi:RNA polymerase sigma-70 factor, ECF subfamily